MKALLISMAVIFIVAWMGEMARDYYRKWQSAERMWRNAEKRLDEYMLMPIPVIEHYNFGGGDKKGLHVVVNKIASARPDTQEFRCITSFNIVTAYRHNTLTSRISNTEVAELSMVHVVDEFAKTIEKKFPRCLEIADDNPISEFANKRDAALRDAWLAGRKAGYSRDTILPDYMRRR